MTTVAMLTQALRAGHCQAYLEQFCEQGAIVMTSDLRAFEGMQLPGSTRLVHVDGASLGVGRKLRSRLLGWSRGGTRLALTVERIARWLVAAVRRLAPPRGTVYNPESPERPNARAPQLALLDDIHRESPIGQIVVFDVFDLPVALEFAEEHQVSVIVR